MSRGYAPEAEARSALALADIIDTSFESLNGLKAVYPDSAAANKYSTARS